MIPILKKKITQILIDKHLLKEADIAAALAVQREKGGALSDILVKLGLVSKGDLMVVLSAELGIPPIKLSHYKIAPEVISLLPKKILKHYKIIPVAVMGRTMTIATSDPLNIFALDDIKALTGFQINPVIADDREINEVIEKHFGENVHDVIEKIVEDMKGSTDIEVLQESAAENLPTSSDLLRMTQEAPVVKITNMILAEAVSLRASDILVEPLEGELRVRYRVDGMLQEGRRPPKALHSAIISRLKVMSELDIAERRLPQDGRFKIKLQAREIDFRISFIPSSRGEKAALRILDKSQATLDLEKLGFDERSLEAVKKSAVAPHGMILACGPTGCGKTTTLYSILNYINSPEDNVITVEDPVEYIIEGVNQVTAKPEIGLTFAGALRSILRQDPDIIMIGEIRDIETVDIAIKAALTGHLVLSTLHTTTATGSIVRLLNMGVEPFLITSSLIAVGAQRLVRKICPNCKESYNLEAALIKKLEINMGGSGRLYRGKGCSFCFGTGYKGRRALIEVLTMTPNIKGLILEGAPESKIREEARREGMTTLRENGMQDAIGGLTTLDEVLRVTVGDQGIEMG